jgi:hypothetical protein
MPTPTARLELNLLESREVPSVAAPTLDLSARGSAGQINGALFRQTDGVAGRTQSIVQIQNEGHHGVEQGYNTDARPLQFDEARGRDLTRAVKVTDLPLVSIGGNQYREVVLDVREPASGPQVSLDELKVYVAGVGNLRGYNERTGKLAGLSPVFDLDAGKDRWIKLDARAGGRTGDMVFDIPAAALGSNGFVYLYSKFGERIAANGGGEDWAYRIVTSPPPVQTAAFAGTLYLPALPDMPQGPTASGGTLELRLNGTVVATATVGDDTSPGGVGSFAFTGVPVGSSPTTFTLVYTNNGQTSSATITLSAGDNLTDLNINLA